MMTIIMTVVMIMIMIMMVMSMTMMSRRCCYGSGEQVAVVCRAATAQVPTTHEPTPPHPTYLRSYGLVWFGILKQVDRVCCCSSTNNHEPTPPHPTYGLVWDSLAGGYEHGIQFRVDCIYA